MIFKDLILKCDANKVVDSIIAAYPDQVKLRHKYVELINKLRRMDPSNPPSDLVLYVSKVIDYFDPNEIYHDVSGYSAKDNCDYGIEFTPFADWLSMKVAQPSVDHYGLDMFVAHCLWEMSFISFEESEVQGELDKLKQSVEEIKSGEAELVEFNPEDCVEKTVSLEPDMPRKRELDRINAENERVRNLMLGLTPKEV